MKNLIILFLFLLPLASLAQLEIPYSVRVLDDIPLDAYYYNTSGVPYTNSAEVLSQVTAGVRYQGQTFNVAGVEYWFGAGTADVDLAIKLAPTGLTGTLTANRMPYATGPGTLADGAHWDNVNTRMGIGAAPSHPLHVTRNQNATTRVQITNTDVTNGSSRSEFRATSGPVDLALTSIGTSSPGGYIGTGTSHSLFIVTGGANRMTLDNTGAVGVGTVPSYRFHAAHNQNASTTMAVTNSDVTSSAANARVLVESGSKQVAILTQGTGAGNGGYIGTLTNDPINLMANGSSKLSIDPAGVVTFGTTPATDNTNTSILTVDGSNHVETRSFASFFTSGTYTPTLTNSVNISSSTPLQCIYYRIGDVVHVSGSVTVSATAAGGTATFLQMSLPIASNLVQTADCTGIALDNSTDYHIEIFAEPTNNRAEFGWESGSTSAEVYAFQFTYLVLP